MKRFLLAGFLAVLAYSAFGFGIENIISPVSGVWNNPQAFVLDVPENCDVYYSLSGSDPLISGFAYDGPVIIDKTGDIQLKISALGEDGERQDFTIMYSVQPVNYQGTDPEAEFFVRSVCQNPLRKNVSGTTLRIPQGFMYSMQNGVFPCIPAGILSVNSENVLDRYIPCTVTDGNYFYHFVIHTVASYVNKAKKTSLPFVIKEWSEFTYTGDGLIYQIDNSYWSASRESVSLDRSVPHVIRWQSYDYEEGNPVESFTLPPKPSLTRYISSDGCTSYRLIEDEYDGVPYYLGASKIHSPLGTISGTERKDIVLDTVQGDSIGGTVPIGVYYAGLYQGSLFADFLVDRQPPQPPVFKSNASGEYSRDSICLTISAASPCDFYYSVSGGNADGSGAVRTEPFKLYDGNPLLLEPVNRNASYYKLSAYCIDKAGNKSISADYEVTVDEFNYYVDASAVRGGDGSAEKPFSSLSDALEMANGRSFTRIHILSDLSIDSPCLVRGNCALEGKNISIGFGKNAFVSVENSELYLSGLQVSREACAKELPLFYVDGGKLSLYNCEVFAVFEGRGALLLAKDSSVAMERSGLTAQGGSFVSCVKAEDCELEIDRVRFTATANDAIVLSVTSSLVSMKNSECAFIAKMGKALELSLSKISMNSNVLKAPSSALASWDAVVWKDSATVVLENLENEVRF